MKIHCIGIGGIAISALANIYQQKGQIVAGSDAEASEITAELKKQGIKVFIGHQATNIAKNIDLVVYSEAVPQNNPELKKARQLKIRCLSGAQALADLAKDYFLIAISGMHGKSTTASMIAQILVKAGLDPTFVIGTKPGFRLGKSKYLIIEADDYQSKFLHYHPNILVLTNIEEEHMDWFESLDHIFRVFKKYISQVKCYVVANKDNANVVKVLKKFKEPSSLSIRNSVPFKNIFYSLKNKEAGELKKMLKVPGNHNVSNALAALNVARLLGINNKIALKALSEYKGVWRRFEEFSLKSKGVGELKIISDYAHHPTEIAATLQALAEKYPKQKKWVVFQPHQYQRTFYLFDKFVEILGQAQNKFGVDKLIITDIYTVEGRESQAIKQKVSSQKLVKAISQEWVVFQPESSLADYLKTTAGQWQVVTIMGAGSVYKTVDQLIDSFPQSKIDEKKQKSKIK